MRTTLDIDDDVLKLGKQLAAGRKIPLGKALSELARRGARLEVQNRNGFHVFAVEPDVPRFGPAEVEAGLSSEDEAYSQFFAQPKS